MKCDKITENSVVVHLSSNYAKWPFMLWIFELQIQPFSLNSMESELNRPFLLVQGYFILWATLLSIHNFICVLFLSILFLKSKRALEKWSMDTVSIWMRLSDFSCYSQLFSFSWVKLFIFDVCIIFIIIII